MRGSVRLKFGESNRKNELDQFKITRGFAQAPSEWRALPSRQENGVSHRDFEFQVYLARNSSG